MVAARRSRRIATKPLSEPIIDSSSTESGSDTEHEADDDYQASTAKRQRTTKRGPVKRNSKPKEPGFAEMVKDFEPVALFTALCDADVSVKELASDWLEEYTEDSTAAKLELINMLIQVSGSLVKLQKHDVESNESSNETIGELQTFFKKQKRHHFYLVSKKPEYKNLRKNLIEFTTQLIVLADGKDILYGESNLIEDLLVWLASMSVCEVRSMRIVSVLVLYTMADQVTLDLTRQHQMIEKLQKQLATENAKKTGSKAAQNKRAALIANITSNLETYQEHHAILENFIKDIVNTTFIHRFKDVDSHIRSDSMQHLATWVLNYEDMFFKVMYLKYFGWLLTDPAAHVRLQVLKSLKQLVNHENSALRQFLEKFKTRIVEMACVDVDINVKIAALNLLVSVVQYLEDSEIMELFHSKESRPRYTDALVKLFHRIDGEDVTVTDADEDSDAAPFNVPDAKKVVQLISKLNKYGWLNISYPEHAATACQMLYFDSENTEIQQLLNQVSSTELLKFIKLSVTEVSDFVVLLGKASLDDFSFLIDIFVSIPYERWVSEQRESEFQETVVKFLQFFKERKCDSFGRVLKLVHEVHSEQLDSLIRTTINEITLSLAKFYSQNYDITELDDSIVASYDGYLKKLLVFGTCYELRSIDIIEDILDKLVSKLPDVSLETIEHVDLNILTSIVAWKLYSLTNLSVEQLDVIDTSPFAKFQDIIEGLCGLLKPAAISHSSFLYKYKASITLADIMVTIKMFYINCESTKLRDSLDLEIRSLTDGLDCVQGYLDTFLICESLSGKELERDVDEDPNLASLPFSESVTETNIMLQLLTAKILALNKLELLPESIVNRCKLNSKVLSLTAFSDSTQQSIPQPIAQSEREPEPLGIEFDEDPIIDSQMLDSEI